MSQPPGNGVGLLRMQMCLSVIAGAMVTAGQAQQLTGLA